MRKRKGVREATDSDASDVSDDEDRVEKRARTDGQAVSRLPVFLEPPREVQARGVKKLTDEKATVLLHEYGLIPDPQTSSIGIRPLQIAQSLNREMNVLAGGAVCGVLRVSEADFVGWVRYVLILARHQRRFRGKVPKSQRRPQTSKLDQARVLLRVNAAIGRACCPESVPLLDRTRALHSSAEHRVRFKWPDEYSGFSTPSKELYRLSKAKAHRCHALLQALAILLPKCPPKYLTALAWICPHADVTRPVLVCATGPSGLRRKSVV